MALGVYASAGLPRGWHSRRGPVHAPSAVRRPSAGARVSQYGCRIFRPAGGALDTLVHGRILASIFLISPPTRIRR